MFLSNSPQSDRQQKRLMFRDAWQKHRLGVTLTGLEKQIASVVEEHAEYHHLLEDEEVVAEADFTPEQGQTNPFLHMGLHLALREQVGTDRPKGIKDVTRKLLEQHRGDGHLVEHRMMECLAEALWVAQQASKAPDEEAYLESLQRLV